MNHLKFSKNLNASFFLFAIIIFIFISCNKIDKEESIDITNQSAIKMTDGGNPGIKQVAIEFVNTPLFISAAEIQRIITDEKELSKKVIILVKDDTSAVKAAGFTILPENWYSVDQKNSKTGGSGGNYAVLMDAGEQASQIKITIPDPTLLDPAVTYGLGFTVSSTVENKDAYDKTIILKLNAKNMIDGRYQLKGFHSRTTPALNDSYDEEVHLITTGANSAKMYWPTLNTDAHPLHGGTTYYSNFTTEFFFNVSTNKLNKVVNTFNPQATPFIIEATAGSRFDLSTRTIYAKYFYNNNKERMFTDTLVYLGSR